MGNKIKDLFDITEEDFEKKETPEKNKNIIEEKNTEKKEEIKKEPLKKDVKKVKKHFKYKNGKIKYMNFFAEGIEGIKDSIKVDSKRTDRSLFLRNIAIAIIILSLVFIFFTIKSSSPAEIKEEVEQNEEIKQGEIKEEENEENIKHLTKEDISNNIKTYNSKEIEKVEKYLNLKSNRVSTVSDISRYKKEKEELYISLLNSKANMTEEEFINIENLLIKSIGMSKELLTVFSNNGGNSEIKSIMSKYIGEENL